eukprot:4968727-Prymnesium_polylepis.3
MQLKDDLLANQPTEVAPIEKVVRHVSARDGRAGGQDRRTRQGTAHPHAHASCGGRICGDQQPAPAHPQRYRERTAAVARWLCAQGDKPVGPERGESKGCVSMKRTSRRTVVRPVAPRVVHARLAGQLDGECARKADVRVIPMLRYAAMRDEGLARRNARVVQAISRPCQLAVHLALAQDVGWVSGVEDHHNA